MWAEHLAAHGIEDREADFVAKRDRLVTWRLEPASEPTPPALRADLAWVSASIGAAVAAAVATAAARRLR